MYLASLLMALASCPSGADIHATERSTFTIKTKELPLAELLECLGDVARFRIIYDDVRPPRAAVSTAIVNTSLKDAIEQLLKGRDLGYALAIDPRGRQEGVLILSTRGSATAAPPRATASPVAETPGAAVAAAAAPPENPVPRPAATPTALPTGDTLMIVLANMPTEKAWAVLSAPGSPGLGLSPPTTLFAEPHNLTPATR